MTTPARRSRKDLLINVIVLTGIGLLVAMIFLPSTVLYVDVQNKTGLNITFASMRVNGDDTAATTLKPGETRPLKVFSGDSDLDRMKIVLIATDENGQVLHTSVWTGTELQKRPLVVVGESPAATQSSP